MPSASARLLLLPSPPHLERCRAGTDVIQSWPCLFDLQRNTPLRLLLDKNQRLLDQIIEIAIEVAGFFQALVIQCKTLDQILAQTLCSPDAKLRATPRLDAITNWDDHIQAIQLYRFVGKGNVQNLHIALFRLFTLGLHIADMLGDERAFPLEQLGDLLLCQPPRFTIHAHIHTNEAVFGLVAQNGFLWWGGFLFHGAAPAMCSASLMRISPDNSLGRRRS